MAERSDLNSDLAEAVERAKSLPGGVRKAKTHHQERRIKAVSLRLSGLSWAQIGERLNISASGAKALVNRSLERAESRNVEDMRALENARLDRAQAAIWPGVLKGEKSAVSAYLQISAARRQMNGLNAPTQMEVSMSIRAEMNQALSELEQMVMEGEVLEDVTEHDYEPRAIESGRDEDVQDAEVLDDEEALDLALDVQEYETEAEAMNELKAQVKKDGDGRAA